MANTKYFTVTIPSTEIPSDQTDVPVFLDLSVLAASHGFFTNARSDAGDVRIYNVTGTKTEVPREIVDYDAVAETGEIHFLADSLLSATDNVFQVEYGDGTLTDYLATDTFGSEAVWANYYFVSHDGGYNDSSGNRNQGTLGNGITIGGATGKIGNATLFDKANSHYLEVGSDVVSGSVALLPTTDDFTIQIWLNQFNVTGTQVADESLVYTQNSSAANNAMFMYGCGARDGHVTQIYERETNAIHLQGADIRATGWRKWEIVRDSVNLTSYIDDVQTAQRTALDFRPATRSFVGTYNNFGGPERFFTGEVDEIRVTHQALSADFRSIEYANQDDPATFYTLSAEQDIGGGGTEVNVNDVGAGADTQTMTISGVVDEVGGGIDLNEINALGSVEESGSVSDDPSVSAQSTIGDSGSTSEDESASANVNPSDSGTGGEDEVVGVSLSVSDDGGVIEVIDLIQEAVKTILDQGSGLSAISISAQSTIADSGAILEVISLLEEGFVQISDQILGSDDLAVFQTIGIEDISVGVDQGIITLTVLIGDDVLGADQIDVIKEKIVSLIEQGLGVDDLSLSLSPVAVSESATGSESEAITVQLITLDSAQSLDALNLVTENLITLLDQGTITEDLTLEYLINISDLGEVSEQELISTYVPVNQISQSVEIVNAFDPQIRIAKFTFTLKHRQFSYTLQQRSMKFTLIS